tara:strand:- start:80 stop:712 length:633 start_codon:yes stop_codon:yes gene_type:complete
MLRVRNIGFILATIATLLMIGCAQQQSFQPIETTEVATMTDPSNKSTKRTMSLGPGDIFEVRVFNEDNLSNVYRVSDTGHINFPFIGAVLVANLTSNQLANYLEEILIDYLKSPQVSVFIKEFHSKKVYVFGQVRKPGTFGYEDGMNIIQAITLAGGLQPLADPNGTYVNRVVDGVEKRIQISIRDIGKGEASNLTLEPGDIIYVPESIF